MRKAAMVKQSPGASVGCDGRPSPDARPAPVPVRSAPPVRRVGLETHGLGDWRSS
jgi:hypothetical protein